eukprot:11435527-Karenia_brevis.AAC.1
MGEQVGHKPLPMSYRLSVQLFPSCLRQQWRKQAIDLWQNPAAHEAHVFTQRPLDHVMLAPEAIPWQACRAEPEAMHIQHLS